MSTRSLRKERIGIVSSDKMEKSVVVAEVKKVKHPVYGKFVLKTKKYVAHDEKNDCNEGDTVRIMETRPMKTSPWFARRASCTEMRIADRRSHPAPATRIRSGCRGLSTWPW